MLVRDREIAERAALMAAEKAAGIAPPVFVRSAAEVSRRLAELTALAKPPAPAVAASAVAPASVAPVAPAKPPASATPEKPDAAARVLAARFDGEESEPATATPAAKRLLASLLD